MRLFLFLSFLSFLRGVFRSFPDHFQAYAFSMLLTGREYFLFVVVLYNMLCGILTVVFVVLALILLLPI